MATHRSITTLAAGSGANGALGSPSGSAAGDIDVIYYSLEDDQPIVPPPGYIILRNQDHASQTVDQWTMWKRLGGSTGGGTVTHASTWRSGACVGVQNASATVNPKAGANSQGTGTTATALTVTPVGNDAYIGYFVNTFGDMGLITPPSGTTPTFTERWDSTNNGYVADGTLATAGATGNKTNTFGGSQAWAALMVVVEDDGVTTDDPTVIQVQRGTITTSRSPSVTFDFAPLEDDIVVFFPSSIDTASITLPSGWNNILGGTTDVESDAHQLCGVYHVVTAGEAGSSTVTFTATNLYDATETGNVIGVVLRNVDTADPIDVTNTDNITTNSTTHVLPGLTPTESDGLYMSCVAKDGSGIYQQLPAGYQWTVDNTNQGKVVAWLETLTTASTPISAQNITATGTDEYASISVVWRKAGAGGATAVDPVPTIVSPRAAVANVSGQADIAPNATTVSPRAAVANVSGQADIAPSATVVTVVAAIADVGTSSTTAVDPVPTVVSPRAAVANVSGQADVAPSATVVSPRAAVANVSATANVTPSPTIVSPRAAVANVSGQADVTPSPTVVVAVAAVADVASTGVAVNPAPTVVTVVAAVAGVASEADVVPSAAVVAVVAGVANVFVFVPLDPADVNVFTRTETIRSFVRPSSEPTVVVRTSSVTSYERTDPVSTFVRGE